MKNIRFSLIAPAIRHNLYSRFSESINTKNKISFEIIFVGNSPPKDKMPSNFQYIYTNVGPSQCLEIAARAASGDYLICTIDDVIFPSGFLNKIDFYLSKLHMEKVLVGNRYQINGTFDDVELTFRRRCINSPVISFMPAFKKDIWEKLGGIDRRFPFAFYDLDIILRFYEIGYSPFVIPDNWANEIWGGKKKGRLNQRTSEVGAELLKRFWVEERQGIWKTVRNRKEPVESFDDKNILTVNQNVFWGKK